MATLIGGRGDRFFGLEAHPFIAESAQVKLSRPGPALGLRTAAREVASRAGRAGVADLEGEHELIRRTFEDPVLATLVRLRDGSDRMGPWAQHLRFATLGVLRDLAGSGWPYPRHAPKRRARFRAPADLFVLRADRIADELMRAPRSPEAVIHCADARCPDAWAVPDGTADACITSPPYLNQVAYAELPRLELYFLKRASVWADLRELGADLVASCVQQATRRRAEMARLRLRALPNTAAAVEDLASAIVTAGRSRRQPKRYDWLLPAYFADIQSVLSNLLNALRPNARAVWIVGDSAPYDVPVDTPRLIAELAVELGFEFLEDRPIRDRGSRWPAVGARHGRRLSERMLVLRRPPEAEQARLF